MEPGCVVANPVVVLREEFDEWAVLYNPDTAQAYGLNPTAVAVWRLVDGRTTADQIAQRVVQQYPGAPPGAVQEALDLLNDLVERGFAAVSESR